MTFSTVRVEGALIPDDILQKIAAGEIDGQRKAADFGLGKTDRLTDIVASVWSDARAYWDALQRSLRRLPDDDPGTTATRNQWVQPLLEALGYQPQFTPKAEVHGGLSFAISHRAEDAPDAPPIHIEGLNADLDKRGRLRVSPHGLVQDYLNRTEHLWGVVTNGAKLRLLRDTARTTRPTFVEFDLEQMMLSESFSDFTLLFRLLHRSRLPRTTADAEDCLLETYHREGIESGGRVREKLRDGVEAALEIFGNGFLEHPANDALRAELASGELKPEDYYRQLLRLIYRLLFLMTAEERKLVGPSDARFAPIYAEGYSVSRLRDLAGNRRLLGAERHGDLWQALLATFKLYSEDDFGPRLTVAPLNGDLFGPRAIPALERTGLSNRRLLAALHHLSWFQDDKLWRRINYSALDVEELGSVYESLLDFHPRVRGHEFDLIPGSERKTTGSYYTRPELVHELIKSALDPVIEAKSESEESLLSLTVCDPACGSGHFLLAAARRIGRRLAQKRSGEDEPSPEVFRIAVRDVVQHCIYGVDLNPLAVDLCKLALWLESHARDKPLTFLDHRIRNGNSLIGAIPDVLLQGIPDGAFKPVAGDDKEVAKVVAKRNRIEGKPLPLFRSEFERRQAAYARVARALADIHDDSAGDVHDKERQYQSFRQEAERMRDETAADLWTSAFLVPLTEAESIPTQGDLMEVLERHTRIDGRKTGEIAEVRRVHRPFHWHLEFPDIFADGGFDCLLGNPPWERIKLQEKEFFSSRSPEIASAPNKAAREKLIRKLQETQPDLASDFRAAKHKAEAQAKFVRHSGRFPLTAVGDVNTFALFAELFLRLLSPDGQSGVILPTGIATDDSKKAFIQHVVEKESLVSLFSFKEIRALFPDTDSRDPCCVLTLSGASRRTKSAEFIFGADQVEDLKDEDRRFELSPDDFTLLNPNTRTCPVFRTGADAELTKKIYRRVPVLVNEATGENPWGVSFLRMFDMASDSGLFRTRAELERDGWCREGNRFLRGDEIYLPLYEAKMIHQYDHRWATYDGDQVRDVTPEEKADPNFVVLPRYWVPASEVETRIPDRWDHRWLLGFRDIARNGDERTGIFGIVPLSGVGHTSPLMFFSRTDDSLTAALLGNLNSVVLDFVTRLKQGGGHLTYFILKQLPVLRPAQYSSGDLAFIRPRVAQLVRSSCDVTAVWAESGTSIGFDPNRRAILQAELDAYYAHLYGLNREELEYMLDPCDVHGADFPAETFRVLKEREIREFGEYRTRRLVLTSWDALSRGGAA